MDEPDLVALFYRADWTRLSLSAEVYQLDDWALQRELHKPARPKFSFVSMDLPPGFPSQDEHRATLRIAPGGRCVIGIPMDVPNPPDRGRVLRTRYGIRPGLPPPYPELLRPSPLLNGFSLELTERIQVAGRAMLRVRATPAPGLWQADEYKRPERIEVTADAETGILLRFEEYVDGRTALLRELTDVTFDPAGEFEIPDGDEDDGEDAERVSHLFSGPGWAATKNAVNVFGTVFGAVAGHAPRPSRGDTPWAADDDPEAAMPPAEERAASGSLASDELLHALYRSGRAEFSATLHQWLDATVCGEWAQARAGDHGWGGIGSAAGALGGRLGSSHIVTRVAIGTDGRYRLDYLRHRRKHGARALVCDGSQRWREFDDRFVVGPVLPPPKDVIEMVDTAALLALHVFDVAETQVSGRRGFALRVAADAPDPIKVRSLLRESDLVVDAELGITLRMTWCASDVPAIRYEFRKVAPLSADGSEFAFNVPPGVRVERAEGGLLDEIDMRAGTRSALRSAGSAVKAAHGLLSSLHRKP